MDHRDLRVGRRQGRPSAIVSGRRPEWVEVTLPSGRRVGFPVERDGAGRAAVVKDAGDDPDCTDGARMTAEVRARRDGGEHVLRAGEGIGTITKPGLGLPVGAPVINPVPRRMILAALAEVGTEPVDVTFSVPGGETMAGETTNARLGIMGGVSILGTSGVVRPFSTASYRASVVQQIDVAAAQGERTVVLATGARSEAAATRRSTRYAWSRWVTSPGSPCGGRRTPGWQRWCSSAWPASWPSSPPGVVMTHFHRSEVDTALLAALAVEGEAPPAVVEAATATVTARHFFDACVTHGCLGPLALLCERARAACLAYEGSSFELEVVLVDYEGSAALWRTGPGGAGSSRVRNAGV